MKYEVRLTREANADILRNMIWWAENHSASQALDWEETIRNQLNGLSEMPARFGFAPGNDNVPQALHQMVVGLGARPSYRVWLTIGNQQ